MATDAPAPAAPKPVKRLALRLDDGTIIRSSNNATAEVLTPQEAWNSGKLTEEHLIKMQALLCELHAKLPEEYALKSISLGTKRSFDSVLEVNQAVSTKTAPGTEPPATAAQAPPSFAGAGSGDWTDVCRQVLAFLTTKQVLDADAALIFRNPPNLQAVPLYPVHIKEPMWLDKIAEKLNTGAYAGPEGFYKDVLLLCDNCYKFNVELFPSIYGQFGVKLENTFLAAWAKSPFAAQVPARPLRPAPPPLRALAPKKSGNKAVGGGAARSAGGTGRARGRPGRPPGVARTKSVNSYGAQYGAPAAPVFTTQMQSALVDALHDQSILEANMQGVIDILTEAGEMGVDEDGEATLDLEKVTPPTAAKLYELVVVRTGRAPGPNAPAAYRPMERDSEDEWDMDDD